MAERPLLIPGFKRILHGGDYNPDQWQRYPEVLSEDIRLMKLAGCNSFTLGVFAWTSYEPEEGRFSFDWLDRSMDQLAKEGHKVILATPSGAKPAWMSAKYPEIRRVARNGLRDPHKDRHNHCWSSPSATRRTRRSACGTSRTSSVASACAICASLRINAGSSRSSARSTR
jgi:beta-galactosidase